MQRRPWICTEPPRRFEATEETIETIMNVALDRLELPADREITVEPDLIVIDFGYPQ
jgi:hypothetical protein